MARARAGRARLEHIVFPSETRVVTSFAMHAALLSAFGGPDGRLLAACHRNDVAGAIAAIEDGANVDCHDESALTLLGAFWHCWKPIHWAACEGSTDLCLLLLENGAESEARAADGTTPLKAASAKGRTEVVKLLLAKGCSPNQRDVYEATPLVYSAFYGHTEVVELLLAAGADKELATSSAVGGLTPLLAAARGDKEDCVRALLLAGADKSARGADGKVRAAAMRARCALFSHATFADRL